jgi:hypothetical protein
MLGGPLLAVVRGKAGGGRIHVRRAERGRID